MQDVIVASPERWDEVCWMVPAVRALVGSGLSIGVLCWQEQEAFWQTLHGVRVIVAGGKRKPKDVMAELVDRWQVALMWQDNGLAKYLVKAKIGKRLGMSGVRWGRWATTVLQAAPASTAHRVQYYLSAVEEMGVVTQVAKYFQPCELRVERRKGSVVIVPDSDFGPSYEWKPIGWYECVKDWCLQGKDVTVIGLKGGRGLGKRLADNLGDRVRYEEREHGVGWLEELASYEYGWMADGSMVHLAAHVGVKCCVLFGPNDPVWKRPLGKQHEVVRKVVECAPCLMQRCLMDGRCQEELGEERVKAAVKAWLARVEE